MKPIGENTPLTLPPALLAEVEAVAEAEHRTATDVVRDLVERGLAERREEDARLEGLLLKGLDSKPVPLDVDFWTRLEAKTDAILDKHGACKTT
jgi:hypothetical protein